MNDLIKVTAIMVLKIAEKPINWYLAISKLNYFNFNLEVSLRLLCRENHRSLRKPHKADYLMG